MRITTAIFPEPEGVKRIPLAVFAVEIIWIVNYHRDYFGAGRREKMLLAVFAVEFI